MSLEELARSFSERSFALLVGVDRYASDDLPELACAARDVEALRSALTGEGGFAEARVRVIADEGATRAAVLKALAAVAADLARARRAPGDAKTRFLFYFAGHGVPSERGGLPETILAMSDTDPAVAHTGIGQMEIADALREIGADQSILVLDCCHAAGLRGARGPASPPLDRFVRAVRDATGSAVISSCREDEVAYERRDETLSVFASALLDALAGEADRGKSGAIFLDELAERLTARVPEIARAERGRTQTPVIEARVSGGPMLLALRKSAVGDLAKQIDEALVRLDELREAKKLPQAEHRFCERVIEGAPWPPGSLEARALGTIFDHVEGRISAATLKARASAWLRGEGGGVAQAPPEEEPHDDEDEGDEDEECDADTEDDAGAEDEDEGEDEELKGAAGGGGARTLVAVSGSGAAVAGKDGGAGAPSKKVTAEDWIAWGIIAGVVVLVVVAIGIVNELVIPWITSWLSGETSESAWDGGSLPHLGPPLSTAVDLGAPPPHASTSLRDLLLIPECDGGHCAATAGCTEGASTLVACDAGPGLKGLQSAACRSGQWVPSGTCMRVGH